MKDKLVTARSSWMADIPILAGSLLLGVLAAFFGQTILACALIFLFLMGGISRLWAFASARKVAITVDSDAQGLFPGEEAVFDIRVQNNKFLPVLWLEVFFPLAENLCLVPEDVREPEEWETVGLKNEGASGKLVGEKRFSFLMWYESVHFTSRWKAMRRGIYSMENWCLRTGDGFGVCQVERPIPRESVRGFAVYPKLIPVSPSLFLRNRWNVDTGSRGVMEDPTVIRSTREYMTIDSLKRINWRLRARGLPLSVNVYEDILPQNVHFLFDGESFSGPEPHLEEMEDALSILASELVRLTERQVSCGISMCKGKDLAPVNFFGVREAEELLYALAAYEPLEEKRSPENNSILAQQSVFDVVPIGQMAQRIGRFYYIAYDTAALSTGNALKVLDHTTTSILTYQEPEPFGEYETICLQQLKEGERHG